MSLMAHIAGGLFGERGKTAKTAAIKKNSTVSCCFLPNFPRGFAAHLRARQTKPPAMKAMSLSKVNCVLPPGWQFSYFCLTIDHEAETEEDEKCLCIFLSLERSY